MEFVHLHIHTSFSLLNGVCKIKKLANKLEELGQKAAAITDHSNMFGVVSFYDALKEKNIKPIIGCEINLRFFGSISHMTVLCENKTGYKNLIKIVSNSYLENFNGEAIVDFDFLKKHKEGLIFLSGCFKGEISKNVLNNNFNKAKEVAAFFKGEFKEENFFLELQDFGFSKDIVLKNNLIKLAENLNLKIVATNNVHYLEKEERMVKDIVHCIKNFEVLDRDMANKEKNSEQYLKSYSEMEENFKDHKEALKNSVLIAKRCEFQFDFFRVNIPKYKTENGESGEVFLEKKAKEGLFLNYGKSPKEEVLKRFYYELKIIVKMQFVDYFLIVYDYVKYAKEHGIFVGPGRGSGAGSLIGFCLGITEIDPIKFKLSFERFLNIYRTKMPDFDVDFCNERRQEVIDYVIKKYGSERVARIVTFGKLAAKAALRDVGRVLGYSYDFVDSIVKLVPNKMGISLKEAVFESLKLKELIKTNEKVKTLFSIAKKVEGLEKNTSIHAAAVVLTEDRLNSLVPLFKVDDFYITQYDMASVERLNLLKMDFLGLRNLTVLNHCEKLINLKDRNFRVLNIPLDDLKTFDMLANGDSVGVFQLESFGMRAVLLKIKPSCLEDVMAVLALNRPGPSRFIDEYVKNKNDRKNIKYLNESMKKILSQTYGVIVYQEQVMEIFKEIAGYSIKNIDLIRKAISKKKFDIMQKERQFFIFGRVEKEEYLNCDGAVNRGIDEKTAALIFDNLEKFALYAFNRAHAASYSIISYKTAYLKCNYLLEYMVCLLNSVVGNKDKLKIYLKECDNKNIKILPVDINKSEEMFKIEGEGKIRFSFLAIKHVSLNFARAIVLGREKKDYSSFEDFLIRVLNSSEEREFNKNAILTLVLSGAFNEIEDKDLIKENFEETLKKVKTKQREIKGQISLFDVGNFKENDEKSKSEILKLKGKVLNIFVKKGKNDIRWHILKFVSSEKEFLVFADEKFFKSEEKIKPLNFYILSVEKVLKNNRTFLMLKDFCEILKKRVLYIKIVEKNFNLVLKLLKENEGEEEVLFFKEGGKSFFKNKNIKGVKIEENLIEKLKELIGKENFKIKNFSC